jgi:hypothetical protein
MKQSPFLMTETEKERIKSLHNGILSENSPTSLIETFQPTNMQKACQKCLTDAIPSEAKDMTDNILKSIDDYMGEGKKPTLDTIKDILFDLGSLQNPMLILSVGKSVYGCMSEGPCKA